MPSIANDQALPILASTEQLLDSAPDGVMIVDATGAIRLMNRRAEAMFGYARDEVLGRPIELLVPEPKNPDSLRPRADYYRNPTAHPMGEGLDIAALRKDGTEFSVDVSLSLLETDQGFLVSAAVRDSSARKAEASGMPLDGAVAIMRDLRGRQFRETDPDHEDAQNRIRILVVDDHEIFAQSLVRLLSSRPELEVVGTAGTVADAVVGALAHLPDVILMDFELPDGDGPQATEQIKALLPAVRVIMLTARTDEQSLVNAIAAGCSGFVKKQEPVNVLFDAIVAANEGETVAPPSALGPLLRQLQPTNRGLGADVTPRELEILQLMAVGLVNKVIARRLGLRLNTVRNHVKKILYKLQAHSKLEAVATAMREGIIRYPDAVTE